MTWQANAGTFRSYPTARGDRARCAPLAGSKGRRQQSAPAPISCPPCAPTDDMEATPALPYEDSQSACRMVACAPTAMVRIRPPPLCDSVPCIASSKMGRRGPSPPFFQFSCRRSYGPATNLAAANGIRPSHPRIFSPPIFAGSRCDQSRRSDAEGLRNFGNQYGFCYSLYVRESPQHADLSSCADSHKRAPSHENAAQTFGAMTSCEWTGNGFLGGKGGVRARRRSNIPRPTSPPRTFCKVVLRPATRLSPRGPRYDCLEPCPLEV